MKWHKPFRHRGLGINLLASFCFLMLAVYGWGMTWEELGSYLLVLVILLGGLIAIAAFFGWLLNKIRRSDEPDFNQPDDAGDELKTDQPESDDNPEKK